MKIQRGMQSQEIDAPLFDQAKRIARSTDPETSKKSAKRLVSSGRLSRRRQQALDAVYQWPGSTGQEIVRLTDIAGLWKRLPELEGLALVRRGQERECSITKERAATWWPIGEQS